MVYTNKNKADLLHSVKGGVGLCESNTAVLKCHGWSKPLWLCLSGTACCGNAQMCKRIEQDQIVVLANLEQQLSSLIGKRDTVIVYASEGCKHKGAARV